MHDIPALEARAVATGGPLVYPVHLETSPFLQLGPRGGTHA